MNSSGWSEVKRKSHRNEQSLASKLMSKKIEVFNVLIYFFFLVGDWVNEGYLMKPVLFYVDLTPLPSSQTVPILTNTTKGYPGKGRQKRNDKNLKTKRDMSVVRVIPLVTFS